MIFHRRIKPALVGVIKEDVDVGGSEDKEEEQREGEMKTQQVRRERGEREVTPRDVAIWLCCGISQ